ncbi:MAG: hypothetical protein IJR77_02825 [Bacteroidales bacterium]|nr:hypothetical protein [Bacteroidales bacterium]
MKNWFLILLPAVLISCAKDYFTTDSTRTAKEVSHGMIVLGEKLEDPYSVENVTKALCSLYPTKADRIDLSPTDLYVRFLPKSEDEFDLLTALGADLVDHPLDYRIVREGDYYHDPAIPEDDVTWQYAVVPPEFNFPPDIYHELLDRCYIAEHDVVTRSDGIDWAAVEREAYRLTGNGDMLLRETRSTEEAVPSGRITIVDPDANGGKPVGVSGVMVVCNTFVKYSKTYTDRDGYYEFGKSFASEPRYRLVFKNVRNFSIGINLVLVPASVSTLGQGDPGGIDVDVTSASDPALFRRCCVNNITYEYIGRCSEDDMDISAPPADLRIWILPFLEDGSALMLHHGAIVDNEKLKTFLGDGSAILKYFLPDITIGTKGCSDYSDIYLATTHELSHASHFSKVGKDYWDHFIAYIVTSYVLSGGEMYGNGNFENYGYCEVGEIWAYYHQSRLFKERYGGIMPSFGSTFWFHPQVFRYLDERGLGRSKLFRALEEDVTSRSALKLRLFSLYPDYSQLVIEIFERYYD